MTELHHQLLTPSGVPIAGQTAVVMEYSGWVNSPAHGYRRDKAVFAISDNFGRLTWTLPAARSGYPNPTYVVTGIESDPVLIRVPASLAVTTVAETRVGIVPATPDAPSTVDLVTEEELILRLAAFAGQPGGTPQTDAEREEYIPARLSPAALAAITGTAEATPDTVVRRNGFGGFDTDYVNLTEEPVSPQHAATKAYVDGQAGGGAIGTSDPTPDTIVRRNEFGGTKLTYLDGLADPGSFDSAARKGYVDALGTPLGTPDTVVRRNLDGWFEALGIWGMANPTDATHAANKNYVDGLGTTAATPDTVVRRAPAGPGDAGGWAVFSIIGLTSAPTAPDHATNRAYVDGLVDAKISRVLTKNTIAANYTLVAADALDKVLHVNSATGITITVPSDAAAAIGQEIAIPGRQFGAGQITFAAGAGATLISRGSVFKSAGQYAEWLLTKVAANTWLLSGDISA